MESEILELQIAQHGKFGYRGPIAMPCFEGRPQPMQGWDQTVAEVSLRVGWPRGRNPEVRSVLHEYCDPCLISLAATVVAAENRASRRRGRHANEELRPMACSRRWDDAISWAAAHAAWPGAQTVRTHILGFIGNCGEAIVVNRCGAAFGAIWFLARGRLPIDF
jgi:hypothetical protein